MALRDMDSCGDFYTTAQMTRKWTVSNPGLNSIDVSASAARFGGYGIRVTIGTSGLGFLSKTLDYQATWILGTAFMYTGGLAVSGHRPIFGFCDNTQSQCEVHLRADGLLAVYRGGDVLTPPTLLATGATPLLEGVSYFLEFKSTIHSSAGTYTVRINGVTDINGTGADTNFTANNSANGYFIGATLASVGTASGFVYHDYDDIHLMDGTGSSPYNAFLGDSRVEAIIADGAGSNVDTFSMADLSSPAVVVWGIMTCMTLRKTDAGDMAFAPVVKSGATTSDGATKALTESYAVYTEVWVTDPDTGIQWTEAGVNAMEAGVKLVS